jgi:lipopolysaccharide/colanic/teichoic acid biosynthesis glycosyltransferase
MSELLIPQHLKVAENVTEEEYSSAIRERRLVVIILIIAAILVIIPLVLIFGLLIGTALAGLLLVLVERVLNKIFKNAHKARTIKMVRYKELRFYREQMQILKHKANSPAIENEKSDPTHS